MEKCSFCGRFVAREKSVPTTAFPPGLQKASTVPYALFVCMNHGKYGFVDYRQVWWEDYND